MKRRYEPNKEILDLVAKRWSPYEFSSKTVEKPVIGALFEAARFAASSFNEQPWRYIIAMKEDKEEFEKAVSCLAEANQGWAKFAPVLAFSLAKKTFSKNGDPNRCAEHDLGAASAFLTLEATRQGLHVHQMAGIDQDAIVKTYQVPEGFTPVAAIAIGYYGDNAEVPAEFTQRDETVKDRKPIQEFVFSSKWNNGF